MKKTPKPSCTCVTQVNAQLHDKGVRLSGQIAIDFVNRNSGVEWPLLRVEWSDKPVKGKKLPVLTCTFCPFCGKKK